MKHTDILWKPGCSIEPLGLFTKSSLMQVQA